MKKNGRPSLVGVSNRLNAYSSGTDDCLKIGLEKYVPIGLWLMSIYMFKCLEYVYFLTYVGNILCKGVLPIRPWYVLKTFWNIYPNGLLFYLKLQVLRSLNALLTKQVVFYSRKFIFWEEIKQQRIIDTLLHINWNVSK